MPGLDDLLFQSAPKSVDRSIFWIFSVPLLVGQVDMLWFAHRMSISHPIVGFATTRPWLRYAVAAAAVYNYAFVLFARRLLKPAMERFRAAGRDGEFIEFVSIAACAVAPGLLGFVYFEVGGPIGDYYLLFAASMTLLLSSMWTYRARFLNKRVP